MHPIRKENRYIALLVSVGVLLRLFHFIHNRSLWEDEFYLSSSFLHMGFRQLATLPLDYQQRAPLGYLMAECLCVKLFGIKEMALRLFPFLCGIASVFLFIPVAKHFLKPVGAIVAIAIFCFAPTLVYHSVEAKQYGTEALATIVALWLYVQYYNRQHAGELLLWGVCGAVVIWFSFTALFVFGGIGMAMLLHTLQQKDWKRLPVIAIPPAIWLFSFALNYLFFVSTYPEAKWLFVYWQNRQAFMPLSREIVFWLPKQTYSALHNPLGLTLLELDYHYNQEQKFLARMPYMPLVCWFTGIYCMCRRNRQLFYVLSFPVLLTLAASALQFYPLQERLILFLSPLLLLFIGEGCGYLVGLFKQGSWWRWAIPVLLVFPAVFNSAHQLVDTGQFGEYKMSHEREAMLYLTAHCGKEDIVYIYWNNLPAYNYYKKAYDLQFPAIEGADVRNVSTGFADYYRHLQPDFKQFSGKKNVWLVYKNFNGIKIGDIENTPAWYYGTGVNAVENLNRHFAEIGHKVLEYYPAGSNHYNDVVVVKFAL